MQVPKLDATLVKYKVLILQRKGLLRKCYQNRRILLHTCYQLNYLEVFIQMNHNRFLMVVLRLN